MQLKYIVCGEEIEIKKGGVELSARYKMPGYGICQRRGHAMTFLIEIVPEMEYEHDCSTCAEAPHGLGCVGCAEEDHWRLSSLINKLGGVSCEKHTE